jgi:hypothetical protein
LASLGPVCCIASSDVSASALIFSTGPPGVAGAQCLTAIDGGLVLAECDGGSGQTFLFTEDHSLVHGGKCLQGSSSTWAGFTTCDQDNQNQWFQLGGRYRGPIFNCWCTNPLSSAPGVVDSNCRMPCGATFLSAPGDAEGSSSAYLVIGSSPLWFWRSSATTPAPSPAP